jgi:hypothetical protein
MTQKYTSEDTALNTTPRFMEYQRLVDWWFKFLNIILYY